MKVGPNYFRLLRFFAEFDSFFLTRSSILLSGTMELRSGLFPPNASQNSSQMPLEPHANGNKKNSSKLSVRNSVGSDNCGSVPLVSQSSLRQPRGFYARLPPLGRSSMSSSANQSNDSKQQREPSEAKLNSLFDRYKVRAT